MRHDNSYDSLTGILHLLAQQEIVRTWLKRGKYLRLSSCDAMQM